MKQIALPIIESAGYPSDFFVTECNKEAYSFLMEIHSNNTQTINRIILKGESGSGKTSLAKTWLGGHGIYIDCLVESLDVRSNGARKIVIDNCEASPELELFHAINSCMRENISVLLISKRDIGSSIPDLNSRLNASYRLQILPPDSELISLMIQHACFMNRIKLSSTVIDHIKKHFSFNSFVGLSEFKSRLLLAAEQNNGKITVETLKDIYDTRSRL